MAPWRILAVVVSAGLVRSVDLGRRAQRSFVHQNTSKKQNSPSQHFAKCPFLVCLFLFSYGALFFFVDVLVSNANRVKCTSSNASSHAQWCRAKQVDARRACRLHRNNLKRSFIFIRGSIFYLYSLIHGAGTLLKFW